MSLLDFLASDDAQLGMNLMAAGGARTDPNAVDFGSRLSGAVNATRASRDANDDRKLRQTYLQGQIMAQQLAAQDAEDKRAARGQYIGLLSGGMGGASSASAAGGGGQGAAGAPAAGGNGMPPSREQAVAAASTGRPIDLSQLNANQVAVLQAVAKQAGMPDPVEVWKAAKPDWQVTNGYRWDKNAAGGGEGFMPGLTVSANGQAIATGVGPDGRPVVYAPRGASEALRGQARVMQEEQNRFQEASPVIDNDPNSPTYGQKVVRSRLEQYGGPPAGPVIGRGGPAYASSGLDGGSTGAAAQGQLQILGQELGKANERFAAAQASGDSAGATRAQDDIAGIRREMSRLPGGAAIGVAGPGGGRGVVNPPTPAIGPRPASNVVELSPMQVATNEARAKGMQAVVTQDAERLKGLTEAATAGQQAIQTATKLRDLAKGGIYEGGGANAKAAVGSLVGGLTGITPKAQAGSEQFNAEASNLVLGQIKALGANPSNADREFIMKTIPQLTTSPAAREAMVDFMERKGRQAVEAHKRADAQFRKTGSLEGFNPYESADSSAAAPARAAPTVGAVQDGYRFKGGNPALPTSWERM